MIHRPAKLFALKQVIPLAFFMGLLLPGVWLRADTLQEKFVQPPPDARPWVYWFWNNGNVTSNGITADLEAMQRVGLGGVLIMDVVERFAPPRGTAEFMNPEWQSLFQFSVQEAARLGLEISMYNGPGWTGSSGAWIIPELAMQKLVWTNLSVTGPAQLNERIPVPDTSQKHQPGTDVHQEGGVQYQDFYRDIVLLAFPTPTNGVVSKEVLVDLTSRLGADGVLHWPVPPGNWVVQRIGYTPTGSSTRPPVAGGNGLECDKLSCEATDAQFAGMLARLIAAAGPLAGKTLTATHIDSWEVGGQDWTPRFRAEFLRRRGYDPVPWLPCMLGARREKAGQKLLKYPLDVGGAALAGRFRWDFQQTISELLAENYAGKLAELAHARGLRLSLEGYNLRQFGDEATYAGAADEPMSEFWTASEYGTQPTLLKGRQMASVAHTMGKSVVGAEAFTSGVAEMWKQHPATIKALGDRQFSQGINRFVFHRYAHQPYLDRAPGATMGPWGLHYERTQTWWEMSGAWHEYLARCQFLLRQGLFVADLCYLRPEVPNQTYFTPNPAPPNGYRYDEISAEALIQRMSVKDGRFVLPDGMSYRLLILPPAKTMTPRLGQKLLELVTAGATVVAMGAPPQGSPSLEDFPASDARIAQLGRDLWGDCDGRKITEHHLGRGRLLWGQPLGRVLTGLGAAPDFASTAELNWVHRQTEDANIYFVANPSNTLRDAVCTFRVADKQPELWDPETGQMRDLPQFARTADGRMACTLRFEPVQSYFLVFRRPSIKPMIKANFPLWKEIAEVTGPWQLSFPTNWGAPASLTLTNLPSWSEHVDGGVRHFSGVATYTVRLDLPATLLANRSSPTFLDLGAVQVMARVTVNGRSCGVAWKAPFRVNVTQALRPGVNIVEISVANLWPNRLIGDAALPEAKRFTWTTWNPYQKDSPLLPSGLLGPVKLLSPTIE